MDEPSWIQEKVVLAIHRRQLAEHGGIAGVADRGLLESALARPRNLFAYSNPKSDIAALAGAYAFGICKNHAFNDGNKRTAFVVCRTFLLLNGVDIRAFREERYQTFFALAGGAIGEEELVTWIRQHIVDDAGRSRP